MRVLGSYCPLKAVWIGVLNEGLVHLHGKREEINGPFPKVKVLFFSFVVYLTSIVSALLSDHNSCSSQINK